MTFDEYDRHDAVGLAALVRQGDVSEAEVLDAALDRIAAVNPEVNAVVLRMDDAARKAVADGLPRGPLAGVPTLLKDLAVDCAGTPTTDGSRLASSKPAAGGRGICSPADRLGLQDVDSDSSLK